MFDVQASGTMCANGLRTNVADEIRTYIFSNLGERLDDVHVQMAYITLLVTRYKHNM